MSAFSQAKQQLRPRNRFREPIVRRRAKQLIRAMAQWFTDGVYFITGNHDERLAKKTGGEVTLQMLLEGEPLNASYYSYMYIHCPSKDEYTYLCHQYSYSKTPVKLAQDVWAVETAPDGSRRKMHIVVTHTHIEHSVGSGFKSTRCHGQEDVIRRVVLAGNNAAQHLGGEALSRWNGPNSRSLEGRVASGLADVIGPLTTRW